MSGRVLTPKQELSICDELPDFRKLPLSTSSGGDARSLNEGYKINQLSGLFFCLSVFHPSVHFREILNIFRLNLLSLKLGSLTLKCNKICWVRSPEHYILMSESKCAAMGLTIILLSV
jgi:hypothetical protein